MRRLSLVLAGVLAVVVSSGRPASTHQAAAPESFASISAQLSEPGGYFDTDNLISNESSYLHVIPDLASRSVRGGVYIGVGPDQNFSYIAEVRPSTAFIVDIRRDNLLLHLLFKALFSLAPTRVEYLSLLFGRPPPNPIAGWETKPIDAVVSYFDASRPMSAAALEALRTRVAARIRTFGVPLSNDDLATIEGFHRQFIGPGLSLQFHSTGRAPQNYYPTYRDLLLETDLTGARRNFLVTEDSYQFLRALQAKDRIIPVVGDLSGPTAVRAIGRRLTTRQEQLTAFYASNVEFYLFGSGTFGRFVANLGRIPYAKNAVIIRSVFGGGGFSPGRSGSVSQTQSVGELVDGAARGRFQSYWELVSQR